MLPSIPGWVLSNIYVGEGGVGWHLALFRKPVKFRSYAAKNKVNVASLSASLSVILNSR